LSSYYRQSSPSDFLFGCRNEHLCSESAGIHQRLRRCLGKRRRFEAASQYQCWRSLDRRLVLRVTNPRRRCRCVGEPWCFGGRSVDPVSALGAISTDVPILRYGSKATMSCRKENLTSQPKIYNLRSHSEYSTHMISAAKRRFVRSSVRIPAFVRSFYIPKSLQTTFMMRPSTSFPSHSKSIRAFQSE